MYTQVKKPKNSRRKSVTNSVSQKKSGVKKSLGFVGNKPESINLKSLLLLNSPPHLKQVEAYQNTIDPHSTSQEAIQRNIISGQADQHNWAPKHVPKRVKDWAASAEAVVRNQYNITLEFLADNEMNTGDGQLSYLNGWNHKRFGGQYCLLYTWAPRQDGKGYFLNVKGVGRKNGKGNDYSLDD